MPQYVRLVPDDRCLLQKSVCAIDTLQVTLETQGAADSILLQEIIDGSVVEQGLLQDLIDQDTGIVTAGISSPALPTSITANTYNSYTIITSGSVGIDGVTVLPGTYTWSSGSNEVLSGKTLTDVSGGSVIILTQQKV